MADLSIIDAHWRFEKFGDPEPLVRLIEEREIDIRKYPELSKLFIKFLRGE